MAYDPSSPSEIPPFTYATDVSTNGTYLKRNPALGFDSSFVYLTRNSEAVLLNDGDELKISKSVTLIYRSVFRQKNDVFDQTKRRERKERYMFNTVLSMFH